MKITTVILDWAGTTVDFGCFAPVEAFKVAFEAAGLFPTMEETRAPMGMQKRAHIGAMLSGKRLSEAFWEAHGRVWTREDVDLIYNTFESALFSVLKNHCDVLPGVLKTMSVLRALDIKVGSTTGYTAQMMGIVAAQARINGYTPDALVCPDETAGVGRPYPYMLHRNLEKLHEPDVRRVVKLGDTAADISEGKNAGSISIGSLRGSSMMGLNEEEFCALSSAERMARYANARAAYLEAGADEVIESIEDLPDFLQKFN